MTMWRKSNTTNDFPLTDGTGSPLSAITLISIVSKHYLSKPSTTAAFRSSFSLV